MQSLRLLVSVAGMLGLAAISPAQLAGSYVVGPTGNYADLTAAIAALAGNGVAAPVTFFVTANQTGQWTIPAFPGQGPANPVVFTALGATTIGGTQPVLTLDGCASVTISGFSGTFVGTTNAIVVTNGAAGCVFTGCDFQAAVTTGGSAAVFRFESGNGCRVEDSSFGGAFEALYSGVADANLTIERCRIVGGGWRIMSLGGSNLTLVNNFITGGTNFGINAGLPGMPTSALNLKIRHNTVHIVHAISSNQYCSLRWYSGAAGTEVVDNVFFDQYPTPTANTHNLWCSGSLRPVVMNYNCLWSNQPGYNAVFAGTALTLAGWQALGFDANSIQADPMFVAPTAVPPDLTLQPGSPCAMAGLTLPQVLTDYFLSPRTPPVSIGAHEEGSTVVALYSVFGPGCPGTAGVPSNTASQPPQLGTAPVITFGNLPPPELALAVLGLSNTAASFGPLPLDLGVIGAPGCMLRVSPDVTLALAGGGGSASLVFPIPNQSTLIGFVFYMQALALDPPLNALGFSASDAAIAVVGP